MQLIAAFPQPRRTPRIYVSAWPFTINQHCRALACFVSTPLIIQEMCREGKHAANSALWVFNQRQFPNDIVSTERLIVPLTDSEAPHLILQGRTFKTEAFGSSAMTRDLSGCRLQCIEDDLPLGFMKGKVSRFPLHCLHMSLLKPCHGMTIGGEHCRAGHVQA